MAYPDFKFPGVELTQEFVDTPVTGVSALGVAVIGQKYVVRDAYTTNPTVEVEYTGSSVSKTLAQLPEDFTVALTGATVDATAGTQTLVVEDGKFEEIAITGGTLTLSTGSSSTHTFSLANATEALKGKSIDVTKSRTVYSGYVSGVDVSGATPTVTAQFTEAFSGGAVTNALIYTKATTAVDVSSAVSAATQTVFLGANGTLTLPANLLQRTGKNSSGAWTYGKALKGGSKFQVYYRAKADTTKYSLGSVASMSEIAEQLGYPCANNPLALAAAAALSASNGNIVYYVATLTSISDTVLKYTGAFDFLSKNAEVYSIVPDIEADALDGGAAATANNQAIKSLLAQVISSSEDKESKIRRTLWFGVKNPSVVDRADLIESILTNKLDIASYRAQAVWADDALYNGEVIPNSAVAAAAAGMRAGQPVHRPISNLGYSFFSIAERYGLTQSELKQLGSNGIWIVGPNFSGTPINMRQVTTDASGSLMLFEESMVSNIDSIALSLCHLGERMVGCSNISPALITALTDGITTVMTSKTRNTSGSDLIGPQLLGWSLDSIYQDPVLRDHVYATMTCEPPRPFNRFVMTLRVV